MNIFNNKKIKNNKEADSLNTFENSEEHQFNVKTEAINEGRNLHWASKIPLKVTVIVAAISLLGSIGTAVYMNSNLNENRQKIAYVADLRQLSERIEKSALQARTASPEAFKELKKSEDTIDGLLKVLKEGGSINGNTSISSMDISIAPQFNKVVTEWTRNKPLLDSLLNQEKSLTDLRKIVFDIKDQNQILLDATSSFQKQVQTLDPKNANAAQELYLLANRINQGLNELFGGESFSLEKGYTLVKDLRTFNLLLANFKNGSSVYGVNPITDPNVLTAFTAVQQAFQPFNNLSEEIVPQVANLYNAKDVALSISNSSKDIVATAEELDREYTDKVNQLAIYSYLIFFLFLLGFASVVLLALHFLDKEQKAENIARDLEKSQNNQAAVDLLLEQISPMGNGDFTNRVYISDKFVTQIAEKVDNTRKSFADMVRKMKVSSDFIGDNANNTDHTSKRLLEVSNKQYAQMEESINRLGHVTSEMDEVAQTTWIAQEESNQSRQASQEGEKLVSQSIAKMDEIRNNIQESSKKIKKSSESAQAITEVTGLIQNITKQIEVLALNAAIQAASSGEAGREFTIVAQEVQRLAFDSKEATQQILQLVKEVQEDIGVAVASMEITTQEVVEGAKLTDNAGQALKKIEQLSQQVASRVAEASEKLEAKSSDMTKISLDMKELQNTTEQSKEIVNMTAKQVEELKNISKELTDTVHGYKVDKN